ncbi:holo-ACP synthase [Aliikangiella maris]|uniref:Holo-ACP synthase n=2 Tax=Aliikangiella maris TaxID=3162458 RepID=A0ABV3MMU3_9GAMM
MAIWGIGIDLCEIERLEKQVSIRGESFVTKILHPNELFEYQTCALKAAFLAKRFAAKEAFLKALGTGISQIGYLTDIEVAHTPAGRPIIHIHGQLQHKVDEIGQVAIHVSISDERALACAQVVIEKLDNP